MIADAIKERLSKDPFEPFMIRSSSGETYPVRSPSLVVLMKSRVFIAEPNSDRYAEISYLHVASVESINGHRATRRRRTR